LCDGLAGPECAGLSFGLWRRLVSHRRRHRRHAGADGSVAAKLSVVLHRAAYARFSDAAGSSAAAKRADRGPLRAWLCLLGDGSRDRLAAVAIAICVAKRTDMTHPVANFARSGKLSQARQLTSS